LVIVDLFDKEAFTERFPRERTPTGALHGRS
jgi:hypothetical protein